MAKPKTIRRVVIAVVIITLLALTPLFCRKREQAISVTTEKVARRDLTELIVANGDRKSVV